MQKEIKEVINRFWQTRRQRRLRQGFIHAELDCRDRQWREQRAVEDEVMDDSGEALPSVLQRSQWEGGTVGRHPECLATAPM